LCLAKKKFWKENFLDGNSFNFSEIFIWQKKLFGWKKKNRIFLKALFFYYFLLGQVENKAAEEFSNIRLIFSFVYHINHLRMLYQYFDNHI